jgi:uncharacterized cupin superfamily protein
MSAPTEPTALRLDARGEGEASPIQPGRLIEGEPGPRAWNGYTDASGQFLAGQWRAGPGRWRVVYEAHEEEFCVLIEGEVRLTDDAGRVQRFRAGDAFVVTGGFHGEWCNVTRVRKHYAIMLLKDPT